MRADFTIMLLRVMPGAKIIKVLLYILNLIGKSGGKWYIDSIIYTM